MLKGAWILPAVMLVALIIAALFPVELRLAMKLTPLVEAAGAGELSVDEAARRAARLMRRHRAGVTVVSVLVVVITAYRGALWFLAHPFGF